MSFLGGLLGGLLSFGGSMANTAMQYAMSKEGQERQYNYQRKLNVQQNQLQQTLNKWNAKNIPLYSRQGMEKAGFNPILAVDSGSAFSAGGQASAGSAVGASQPAGFDTSSAIDSATNAYRAFQLDRKMNEATIRNLDESTKNTAAKTVTEGYNQQLLQSQYLLNQINTELGKKDLSWKDRIYLMQEKTGYINAVAAHLGAEAAQLNANTAKQHYNLDREMKTYEKDMEKRYMEFGKQHPYIRNTMESAGRFFKGFSASYSKR